MKIDAQHPQYAANVEDWTRCRDTYAGQRAVKAKATAYLPKISPQQSSQEYQAFLGRAFYYEAVGRTIDGFTGAVSRKEHSITLPARMEFLMGDVSGDGIGLAEFSKKVLTEILLTARAGLLIDLDADTSNPFVSLYNAESVINWGPDRVVLSETEYDLDADGVAKPITQFRDLHMVGGACHITVWRKVSDAPGKKAWQPVSESTPTRLGRPVDRLPWAWLSAIGPANRIERPPLLGLVNVSLSHYLNSASLEHGRHFCGIPTMYVTGCEPEDRPKVVGAQSLIVLKDAAAKCGYAEFSGHGLRSLETALEQKQEIMARLGAAALGAASRQIETAEAARIRTSGENSLLAGIISSVEQGLIAALRLCAWWMSVPDDEAAKIAVRLNRDVIDTPLDPQTITALVGALQQGGITAEQFQFSLLKAELLPPNTNIADEAARLRAARPAQRQPGAQQNGHA